MPVNDIIDNRHEKLVDNINRILDTSQAARFAVGYFFLSGLEAIAERLERVGELRLLIGNTTNRETLEQIAEGYRRLEIVKEAAEAQAYPKRVDVRRMAGETAVHVRETLEMMDQTDEAERLVGVLARMIEQGKLKVRVYMKGRMHAKAYIFDYGPVFDQAGRSLERQEKGIAIVGSSNLTLSGVSHNTELNVIVDGNDNHAALVKWFDELWGEADEFDEALMHEIQQSWALAPTRPYDVYMKTLYALVRDRLEGAEEAEVLWDDEITSRLADFQKVAVRQAAQIIRDFGGGFVADVVGLGTSYIGAAIIKQFERNYHSRALVICPATLEDMWKRYNEVFALNAQVLSMGYLTEGENAIKYLDLDRGLYRDRDFVLIDESHNFRNTDTQRYRVMQEFLRVGKPCCLLTATPRNKSVRDVYSQIKLFHQSDLTDLPIDPPNLREYFRLVEEGRRQLPGLLAHILIRRTRNHILRWYGYDEETQEAVDPAHLEEYLDGKRRAYVLVGGRHQFFPHRELRTIEYSIEHTYAGLYGRLRGYLGKPRGQRPLPATPPANQLVYARYGLWHYVKKEKQSVEPYASLKRAGANLCPLIRVMLFKRFQSSVFAFRETLRRMLRAHVLFREALGHGVVPAGEEAQDVLTEPEGEEAEAVEDVMDRLRHVTGRYSTDDLDLPRLQAHIDHDIAILGEMLKLVEGIGPEQDAKLQTLKRWLDTTPLNHGKRLIFTEYADTARYLFENLNPGGGRQDIEAVYSGNKSKGRIVGQFAPKANQEQYDPGKPQINTLIATDVMSEGLNLQDCDKMVNYDLHWNPVRLIQRFGRIDRIGSDFSRVYGFNFLPETALEANLGLHQKLAARIQDIHDTIGEDAAILDPTERLNEEAMYAIYEQHSGQLSMFEEDGEEDLLDLNEAEEIMRQLRRENPEEYERVACLRDGIRASMASTLKGSFVFCQAGRYQQLFLVNGSGEIISRDIPRVLGAIKCAPGTAGRRLPDGYNQTVMRVKRLFDEEVKQRRAERAHTLALSQGQRYVLRELRTMFGLTEDEDTKARINLLERAFRGPVTGAINKELNRIRANGLTGQNLVRVLGEIYYQHRMGEWIDAAAERPGRRDEPRVVCSEDLY